MLNHKGWFVVPGLQRGDRTVEQQLLGLETVADRLKGRYVLDVGCAEGLIGRHCVDAWGAAHVDGLGVVPTELNAARELCSGRPMRFFEVDLREQEQVDAVSLELLPAYDVVLLLSILHKMRDPMQLLEWACERARELVVIRLPAPTILTARLKYVSYPVHEWMCERYALLAEPATCIEPNSNTPEWMGVYAVRA